MKQFLAIAILALLNFSSTTFANFTIEVCKVPMRRLIDTDIVGVKHVFMRGTKNGVSTALNFGPVSRTNDIALGHSFVANVTNEDYYDAECKVVLETESEFSFSLYWDAVVKHYQEAAQSTTYQVYGVRGKNCGMVAKDACAAACLTFPFDNINGQDHTANLLYGIGDIATHGGNAQNVHQVFGDGLGALGGIVREFEGGEQAGEVVETLGAVVKNQNCCVQ